MSLPSATRGTLAAGDKLKRKELESKKAVALQLTRLLQKAHQQGASDMITRFTRAYGPQAQSMLMVALGRQASGTVEGHLSRWKAFATWACDKGLQAYPTEEDTLVKYLQHRVQAKCGISVPTAVRTTVTWMHKTGHERPRHK
jgi:hypothetical protein